MSSQTLDAISDPKPTRDQVFYSQIIFRVGNTLFQAPSNAFNVPGTKFAAMYTLPPPPGAEGSSDENPIVLSVDEDDFRGFLYVVCGKGGYKLTDENWFQTLKLATLWDFDDVRNQAVQALRAGWVSKQTLKQLVLTAKEYKIDPWLEIAYTQLVLLGRLPFEDLIQWPAIDWETIARLYFLRKEEQMDKNKNRPRPMGMCPACGAGEFCCEFVLESVRTEFMPAVKKPLAPALYY